MNAFLNYLSTEAAALKEQERQLSASHRKDEANLTRIRMNIFEICKTVHGALAGRHAEGFEAAYLAKLDEFEAAWQVSRKLANAHADAGKALIEQIKIEALADIRKKFTEVGNAAHE